MLCSRVTFWFGILWQKLPSHKWCCVPLSSTASHCLADAEICSGFCSYETVTTAGHVSPNTMPYTKTILKNSFHMWKGGSSRNFRCQTRFSQPILKERDSIWHKKALHGAVIGTVTRCQLQLFSGLYKCWSWKYIMRSKGVNNFSCLVLDITWTCAGYFFTPSSSDVCLYLHAQQNKSGPKKERIMTAYFRNTPAVNSPLLHSYQRVLNSPCLALAVQRC